MLDSVQNQSTRNPTRNICKVYCTLPRYVICGNITQCIFQRHIAMGTLEINIASLFCNQLALIIHALGDILHDAKR